MYDALTYAGNLANIRDVIDDRRCRFVQGDICDQDDVLEAMEGHDAVVHFAAETHVDRSIKDGYSFVRTNCFGTNVLCDVARQVGVERFLHISTDEVYGSIEVGSFAEDDRLGPRSPYSAAKAGSDLIALELLHDARAAGAGHAVQQQLRAVPVPGEGHPAVHHQPARRRARCRCTATAATSATGSTCTTTTPPPISCCARATSARSTTSAPATRSPTTS